jgi:hypothetical protein
MVLCCSKEEINGDLGCNASWAEGSEYAKAVITRMSKISEPIFTNER